MKRVISILCLLILCLSLFGCGKSESVKAFDEMVAQISTVTLDSGNEIQAAESAFAALTEKDQKAAAESQVALTQKREQYDAMVNTLLQEVTGLANAIGSVSLASEAAIIAAEEAFAALPDAFKAMIPDTAQLLNSCRAAYEEAVANHAAEVAAEAAEVSGAIDAIGAVTLESKDLIAAAQSQYNALSEEGKALVTNYAVLEAAEGEYDILWEAERQAIIKKYSKKYDIDNDPIEGISWYMHKDMPNYIDTRSYIIPYIGVKGNNAWICIRYNYTADSWIFWENLTIMVDGEKYFKFVGYYDTIRDNDTEVWEFYDECLNYNQAMDSEELLMLRAIADSEETIIRFQGDEYHYDLYVGKKDKQMIKDTLALYEALLP